MRMYKVLKSGPGTFVKAQGYEYDWNIAHRKKAPNIIPLFSSLIYRGR